MQRYWAHYSEKGPFIQNWYNNNGDCAKKFDWHLIATKNNQLYCTWWQSNFVHKKICDPGIAHPIANNALVYLETLINKSNPRIKVDHYLKYAMVYKRRMFVSCKMAFPPLCFQILPVWLRKNISRSDRNIPIRSREITYLVQILSDFTWNQF